MEGLLRAPGVTASRKSTCLWLVLSALLYFNIAPCVALSAAVVGAGEQGIVAAVELQRRGYNVTVVEKQDSIVPVLNSVNISQQIYDYLSVTLLPAATFNGSGTLRSLQDFAARYNQAVEAETIGLPAFTDLCLGYQNGRQLLRSVANASMLCK